MVAVSGALAMSNAAGPLDDIDILIVTQADRLWLARMFVILVVHALRPLGVEICPNYVMPEHRLELHESGLFAAHELAQLVPLYGLRTYEALMASNRWLNRYLPNVLPRSRDVREASRVARWGQGLMEAPFGGSLGDSLERGEQRRRIPRFRRIAAEEGATETAYTPHLYKAHRSDHGVRFYERYLRDLSAQGM
jgi:hypothetical protein